MYDQIAYYSVLSQPRPADRTAGRSAKVTARAVRRMHRERRTGRRHPESS